MYSIIYYCDHLEVWLEDNQYVTCDPCDGEYSYVLLGPNPP